MRVRDFNLAHRTLLIQWGKGKGDEESRNVVLTEEAVAWFKGIVKGRDSDELMWRRKEVERVSRGEELDDPNGWASYDQVHAMQKAVKKAGILKVGFHELRHTYASALLNAGCSLSYVAEQLGHKDTRMCVRHYGHIARPELVASIEKHSPRLGVVDRP